MVGKNDSPFISITNIHIIGEKTGSYLMKVEAASHNLCSSNLLLDFISQGTLSQYDGFLLVILNGGHCWTDETLGV